MLRKAFQILLCLIIFSLSRSLFAADACVVLSSNIPPYREGISGFKETFRGGVTHFVLEGEIEASSEIASKIKSHKCEIVVAFGSTALNFLKMRITEKPVIYAMVLNPRSIIGGQKGITGVHLEVSPESSLSAIRRIIPNASRIGVLYNPSLNEETISAARRIAAQLKVELLALPAQSISEAVSSVPILAARTDVIWMIPDAITSSQKVFEVMLATSLRRGVPLFALSKKHVSEGGLAALSTDYLENGRQAGRMAVRIASGSPVSAIRDEFAAKAGIVLNLVTAKKLEIEIPKAVVSEAAEVYR